MNFTREPIIETVIMPREGYKLLVRNSKGTGHEEYYVDSVEVISFGQSLFFRSQERPKSFIVPVSDYEVLEQKEARLSLKNVAPERAIKIGGGREGSVRQAREVVAESEPLNSQERDRQEQPPIDRDRKRDKRRRGRRGNGSSRSEAPIMRDRPSEGQQTIDKFPEEEHTTLPSELLHDTSSFEEGRVEEHKAPSFISKLFPPPPMLIKDTLSRYKPAETEGEEGFPEKEQKFEDPFFDSSILPEEKILDPEQDDDPLFEE